MRSSITRWPSFSQPKAIGSLNNITKGKVRSGGMKSKGDETLTFSLPLRLKTISSDRFQEPQLSERGSSRGNCIRPTSKHQEVSISSTIQK